MKCPKCDYLGFETGDRCKNCGYDFSLMPIDAADADLPLREPEPFAARSTDWLDAARSRDVDRCDPRRRRRRLRAIRWRRCRSMHRCRRVAASRRSSRSSRRRARRVGAARCRCFSQAAPMTTSR